MPSLLVNTFQQVRVTLHTCSKIEPMHTARGTFTHGPSEEPKNPEIQTILLLYTSNEHLSFSTPNISIKRGRDFNHYLHKRSKYFIAIYRPRRYSNSCFLSPPALFINRPEKYTQTTCPSITSLPRSHGRALSFSPSTPSSTVKYC